MSCARLATVAALIAASGILTRLSAQEIPRSHAVELTFDGGYFQPTGTAGQTGTIALTRRPGWVGGARFDVHAPGGFLSGEVSIGYAAERIRQTGTTSSGVRGTNLSYGTAKLLIGRNPRKPGVSYMVGGGLSAVHRKKSVLDSAVGSTHFGAVASLMLRFPIDGQVGLRLDAEDLIYSADFGLGKKMRNDVVLTAGLGISW